MVGAALIAIYTGSATSQTVQANKVTMCDLFKNPELYSGKLVQFRASVANSDTKHFWIDDFAPAQGCDAYMRVVIVFPNDVTPKPSFQFVEDDSWRKFASQVKSANVEATFVGIFEPYFVWREHKRVRVADISEPNEKHEHGYDGRVVLLNISDVLARTRSPMR
jgi:hypothetical protein